MLLTDVQNYFEIRIIHDTFLAQFSFILGTEVIMIKAGHLMSARPNGTQWDLWAKMNQNDGRSTWEGLLGIGILIHCKNHCWTVGHAMTLCFACALAQHVQP